jgi:hypothetical protein
MQTTFGPGCSDAPSTVSYAHPCAGQSVPSSAVLHRWRGENQKTLSNKFCAHQCGNAKTSRSVGCLTRMLIGDRISVSSNCAAIHHSHSLPLGHLYAGIHVFSVLVHAAGGLSQNAPPGLEPVSSWIHDRISITIRELSRSVISGTMGPDYGYMNLSLCQRLSLLQRNPSRSAL